MMDKVMTVAHSFAEAEHAEKAYYQRLTPLERLAILLELNRRWTENAYADAPPRLQRVYRIAKLP